MKYILIILMIVGFSSTAQAHDSYAEDTWRCLAEETAAYSYHMTVLHKENRFFYTYLTEILTMNDRGLSLDAKMIIYKEIKKRIRKNYIAVDNAWKARDIRAKQCKQDIKDKKEDK